MVETVKSCGFLVSVMGEIEKAYIQDIDNIYVKYCFVYGKDWDVTSVSSFFYPNVILFIYCANSVSRKKIPLGPKVIGLNPRQGGLFFNQNLC